MTINTPAILFQSTVNPKVKITLEFGKQSEDELKNMLKHMQIEKIKKEALESTLQKNTESKEIG